MMGGGTWRADNMSRKREGSDPRAPARVIWRASFKRDRGTRIGRRARAAQPGKPVGQEQAFALRSSGPTIRCLGNLMRRNPGSVSKRPRARRLCTVVGIAGIIARLWTSARRRICSIVEATPNSSFRSLKLRCEPDGGCDLAPRRRKEGHSSIPRKGSALAKVSSVSRSCPKERATYPPAVRTAGIGRWDFFSLRTSCVAGKCCSHQLLPCRGRPSRLDSRRRSVALRSWTKLGTASFAGDPSANRRWIGLTISGAFALPPASSL